MNKRIKPHIRYSEAKILNEKSLKVRDGNRHRKENMPSAENLGAVPQSHLNDYRDSSFFVFAYR